MTKPDTYPDAEAFLRALQATTDDPFRGPSLAVDGTLYRLLNPEPPRPVSYSVDSFSPRVHVEHRYGENLRPFESTSDRDAALLQYLASAPVEWPAGTARVS